MLILMKSPCREGHMRVYGWKQIAKLCEVPCTCKGWGWHNVGHRGWLPDAHHPQLCDGSPLLPCPSCPILTRQAACPIVLSAMVTWRVSPCKITDRWIFLPWGSARPPTLGVPPIHHETGSSSSLFPGFCCDSMIFCNINVFPLVSFSLPPSSPYHPLILGSFTRKKSRNGVICYGTGSSSTREDQGKLPQGATPKTKYREREGMSPEH